jgi:nitrogen fixation protein NifB
MTENKIEHPCYNADLLNTTGRIHLPVAIHCNLQCNYCAKSFDCPNENRPGVCTIPLKVDNVKNYIEVALQKHPCIKIAGIAGPAEALADVDTFEKTFMIVKKYFPTLKTCFATNGIMLADYINLINSLQIDYITITINALSLPAIQKIYSWVYYDSKYYYDEEAAKIIHNKQTEALKKLSENNYKYKINTILIDEINFDEVENIAKVGHKYGAAAINPVSLIPVKGTAFENANIVKPEILAEIRKRCKQYLPVIKHCKLCRADAVGFL